MRKKWPRTPSQCSHPPSHVPLAPWRSALRVVGVGPRVGERRVALMALYGWRGAEYVKNKVAQDEMARPYLAQIAARLRPGCRVLDVGCGDGSHTIWLAEQLEKLGGWVARCHPLRHSFPSTRLPASILKCGLIPSLPRQGGLRGWRGRFNRHVGLCAPELGVRKCEPASRAAVGISRRRLLPMLPHISGSLAQKPPRR